VTDGFSNTIGVTEASQGYGSWGAGGKSTLRSLTRKPYINGPDGIGSPFPGGLNVLMLDGSVRFLSENIDPEVMEALVTIHGGEVIGDF
jgi:prepilin-type processing-associated H-X9-DG protein